MKTFAIFILCIVYIALPAISQDKSGNAAKDRDRSDRNPSSTNVGHDGGSNRDKEIIDKIREHNKEQKEVREKVKEDLGWDPYKLDQTKAMDFWEGITGTGSRERNDRPETNPSPSPTPVVVPGTVAAVSKNVTVSKFQPITNLNVTRGGELGVMIWPRVTISNGQNTQIRVGVTFIGPMGGWYIYKYYVMQYDNMTTGDGLFLSNSILKHYVSNNSVTYWITVHQGDKEIFRSPNGTIRLNE